MPAARQNLYFEQGSTFRLTFTWLDSDGNAVDMTGYQIRMQLRDEIDADPLLDIDSSALQGGVTLAVLGATGVVDLTISDELTSLMTFDVALYDLTAESAGGVVTRLIEGRATLSRAVTR